ncbi:MAG: hypothetical protein KC492_36375, partial [Myxococcales bacterium]|nr:hypothetical protein [Myxococcales bacterium]
MSPPAHPTPEASSTSTSPRAARYLRRSTTLGTLVVALFLGVRCNGCQREQPVEPKGAPSLEARVSIVTDAFFF